MNDLDSHELEKVVRAAIRLDKTSVNYLPTVVGDGGCDTWHVYVNGERVGTIGEELFKRLEDFRSKLKNAELLHKADVALGDLLTDGGVLQPEQASRFVRLALSNSTIGPDAKITKDDDA